VLWGAYSEHCSIYTPKLNNVQYPCIILFKGANIMARRSDHTREELREMALKAAREIVKDEGIQKLTTRAVAKRIGYSVGTLYVIFKNVDDLKFGLNALSLAEMRTRMVEATDQIVDPAERLMAMGHFYLGFGLASQSLWRLMFEHQLPGDEPIPEVITRETDALLVLVRTAIKEILPAASTEEVTKVAAAFWSALHGVAHLMVTDKLHLAHVDSAHDVLTCQMELLIKGIKLGI
jgi:AcrR family transcriptional regulator